MLFAVTQQPAQTSRTRAETVRTLLQALCRKPCSFCRSLAAGYTVTPHRQNPFICGKFSTGPTRIKLCMPHVGIPCRFDKVLSAGYTIAPCRQNCILCVQISAGPTRYNLCSSNVGLLGRFSKFCPPVIQRLQADKTALNSGKPLRVRHGINSAD